MNKLILSIVVAFLLSLFGTSFVWAKAHVPIDRGQLCIAEDDDESDDESDGDGEGKVRVVKEGNIVKRLAKGGACRLPTCVFNQEDPPKQFVFMAGDDCDPTDDDGDGFCDATGTPDDISTIIPSVSAVDVTPGCSNPF